MRGVDLAVVQHPLRIGPSACPEGAVWPKVAVDERDLAEFASSSFPVLDALTPRSGWLLGLRPRGPLADDDLQQLAPLNSRQDLSVENLAQFRKTDPLNRRPCHV